MTQEFSSEAHLLAGKLVPFMAIHPLGDSRANRHHTPYPQPGAAQPTQDGDHTSHAQSTRVAFGAPLGKAQEPLTIHRSEPETNTTLHSTILAAPGHLGVDKHQE